MTGNGAVMETTMDPGRTEIVAMRATATPRSLNRAKRMDENTEIAK